MSETKYLKCSCQKCGGSIEFPAQGLGLGVNCPHCGQRTTLFAPEAVLADATETATHPTGEASQSGAGAVVGGWLCFGLAIAFMFVPLPTFFIYGPLIAVAFVLGIVALAQRRIGHGIALLLSSLIGGPFALLLAWSIGIAVLEAFGIGPRSNDKPHGTAQTRPVVLTNENSDRKTAEPAAVARKPKSLDDLKVGPITLEKAKSGSLIYAVGVLKNDSDHQRYGVKVELDVTDAKGGRPSKASDYTQVIEPRKEWRFRALVLDSRAATAKLSRITEDE